MTATGPIGVRICKAAIRLQIKCGLGLGIPALDLVQDYSELIAADAGGKVRGPQARRDRLLDRGEDGVSRGMPVGVIDRFEAVDVEQNEGGRPPWRLMRPRVRLSSSLKPRLFGTPHSSWR